MILSLINELDKEYLSKVNKLLVENKLEEARKLKIVYLDKLRKIMDEKNTRDEDFSI